MPTWVKQWLPSMILPVLGLVWYAMDDRATMRQRMALLERENTALTDERLDVRVLTLEIQLKALALSMATTREAFLLFAENRLDE